MNEGREHLLRVWHFAEDLVLRSGKPLQAFLVLHHLLTQPPSSLRRAAPSHGPPSPSNVGASLPLHLASLDGVWKCEELATRVRAAEYLLFPDAHTRTSTAGTGAVGSATSHTLSRAASLEAMALAEQTLAPVFAASSFAVRGGAVSTSGSTGDASGYGFSTVLGDAVEVGRSSAPPSGSKPTYRSNGGRGVAAGGDAAATDDAEAYLNEIGVYAETRVSSMYFLNESTVTALAWPLSRFTLDWPLPSSESSDSSSSSAPLRFRAANHTIVMPVSLVVRAHVLLATLCHRRVQYTRAVQCLEAARRWVRQQFAGPARERSQRLLWADLQERWDGVPDASSALPLLVLSPQRLLRYAEVMQRIMTAEQRACEVLISVEECHVHHLLLQTYGALPVPSLPVSLSTPSSSISGAAPQPDLRLHSKRYHDSVQKLYGASQTYMSVLTALNMEGNELSQELVASTEERESEVSAKVQQKSEEIMVKKEEEGEEEEGEISITPLPIAAVWLVQSQLSPFCFCALHCRNSTRHQNSSPSARTPPLYGVCLDVRLAAEVLAWYHCLSLVFLLYQNVSVTGSSRSRSSSGKNGSSVDPDGSEEGELTERREIAFLARYASPSVEEANAVEMLKDPVRRALEHFRVYATVFGAIPSASNSSGGDGGDVHHKTTTAAAEGGAIWRAPSAATSSSAFPPEAALLLCLGQLALHDDHAFILCFQRAVTVDGLHTSDVRHAAVVPGQKRSRSPPSSVNSSISPPASIAVMAPPLSWHWVRPGVRAVLLLYLELTTVLMHAAATTSNTVMRTPPVSPTLSSSSSSAPKTTAAMSTSQTPFVVVLQAGLRRAEQLMARLLFHLDKEMLQLTGNAWSTSLGAAVVAAAVAPSSATVSVDCQTEGAAPWGNQLQCAASAQLRWLVQLKTVALLTMARHHLTQLSIVRAVQYLRDALQFTRVFQCQTKLMFLPESHMLLAAAATCLSLRRLPQLSPMDSLSPSTRGGVEDEEGEMRRREERSAMESKEEAGTTMIAAFAQGWPAGSSNTGGATSTGVPYAILPEEEAVLALDVGLPYLHLLASERAACASLHTAPAFLLLVRLLKVWAVYQLASVGEELTWVEVRQGSSTSAGMLGQKSNAPRGENGTSSIPPLPTASHATTTLNSTVEDQQRRAARLDSLTTTPTSTPTLRSRHAALPAELHRINLDSTNVTIPCGGGGALTGGSSAPLLPPPLLPSVMPPAIADATPTGRPSPIQNSSSGSSTSSAAAASRYGNDAPLRTATSGTTTTAAHMMAVPRTVRHRAADLLQRMIGVLSRHYDACVASESDAEDHKPTMTTPSHPPYGTPAAVTRVPVAAWTPHNRVLFRLLRGAVLLTEDHDELAAARELKAATHAAKTHLGVLHPFVADGLVLLTNAYAALDVEGEGERGDPESASRTRKVAVQLAMRCSCTALAALAAGSGSLTSTTISNASNIPTPSSWSSASTSVTRLEGTGSTENGSHSATNTTATPSLSLVQTQLQDWWRQQVLVELCGGSTPERAIQRLRVLFEWLPGTKEYSF